MTDTPPLLPRRRRSSLAWRQMRAVAPYGFLFAACLLCAGLIRVTERSVPARGAAPPAEILRTQHVDFLADVELGVLPLEVAASAVPSTIPSQSYDDPSSLLLEPVGFGPSELDWLLSGPALQNGTVPSPIGSRSRSARPRR